MQGIQQRISLATSHWLAILLLTPTSSVAQELPNGPDLGRWTIKVFGSAAPGSGVVIKKSNNGCLALTAGHVVKGTFPDDEAYAMYADGRRTLIRRIEHIPPLDIAELELESCGAAFPEMSTVSHRGGRVWVGGFPRESKRLWIRGGTSEMQGGSTHARDGGYAIFHSAPTRSGISGGGLYDSDGLLIGIHGEADTVTTKEGSTYKSGIGLAIPISFWQRMRGKQTEINHDVIPSQTRKESELQDSLLRLGRMESSKQLKGALALANEIIQAHPGDQRAITKRASLLMTEGNYTEALQDYDTLIRAYPDNAGLFVNRGNALLRLKRFEEALRDYDHAINRAPRLSLGFLNKSKALMALGKRKEALENLNKALRLSPREDIILLERALVLQRLGRNLEARLDLDRLIERRPDNPDYLSHRGVVRGILKDNTGSIDDLASAVALQPNRADIRINLAASLARIKKWQDAEVELRKAQAIQGDTPELLANMGEVAYFQGRGEEACNLARRAQEKGFDWRQGEWDETYRKTCLTP